MLWCGSLLRLLCIALVHVKAEAADLPCLIGSVAKSSLGAGYSRLVVFAQGLRPSYGQSDQEMIGTAMYLRKRCVMTGWIAATVHN